jgi:hypothetical protein
MRVHRHWAGRAQGLQVTGIRIIIIMMVAAVICANLNETRRFQLQLPVMAPFKFTGSGSLKLCGSESELAPGAESESD